MTAIYQLIYSEKYKASWIYYITPVATPGQLLTGALKSLMAKFYLPLAVTQFHTRDHLQWPFYFP
jgi:ABC-2 type transport system permease protein